MPSLPKLTVKHTLASPVIFSSQAMSYKPFGEEPAQNSIPSKTNRRPKNQQPEVTRRNIELGGWLTRSESASNFFTKNSIRSKTQPDTKKVAKRRKRNVTTRSNN